MLRILPFLFVLSGLFGLTAYKVYQLEIFDGASSIMMTVFLFFIMIGSQILYRTKPKQYAKIWFQFISWLGALTMGYWATLLLVSIPIEIVDGIWSIGFSHNFNVAVFGFCGLMTIVGFAQVLVGPKLVSVKINLYGLHPDLQNLKIAQISDLHIGPTIRRKYVQNVVQKIRDENPDLLFITGDLADAKVDSIKEILDQFKELKPKYGSYYAVGNHEYYWGVDDFVEKSKTLGWQPLLNENKLITIGQAQLLVGGVPDPSGVQFKKSHQQNFETALACTAKPDLRILLAHRPNDCVKAEAAGFDIQFSGHTHAGQFFPFSLLVPLAHKYHKGLNKHGKMWIYVSPGTGYWGPPHRFAVASEITIATLV